MATLRNIAQEIETFWRQCPKAYRPSGAKGHKLLRYLLKHEIRREYEPLNNWLLILDEMLYWCTLDIFALQEQFIKRNSKRKIEFGGFIITLATILNHTLAIRQLCMTGFDLSAKQVLRSLIEYVELLMLFDKDPKILKEYPVTDELEDANRFWHLHLSRGKARKRLFAESEDSKYRIKWNKLLTEWWEEERKILGASVHPSRAACWAAYTACIDPESPGAGFLGSVSINSVRTVRVTVMTLAELFLFCGEL